MPRESRRRFSLRDAHVFAAFRPLFEAGNAKPLILAAFLWQFAHMVYPVTWAFFAELALGWNEQMIGWSLAASGLCMALIQTFVMGRSIKWIGEERTVMIGMLAGVVTFVAYIFVRQTWIVYALIPIGAIQGLAFPGINALMSRVTDPSRQGALQGGVSALNSVVLIFAPLVLSQALAFGSERGFQAGNFVVATVLACAALLIIEWRVVPKTRPTPVA
jgi:DHA1 family tetracycline resistance protein-like MFS transporter